MTFDGVPGGPTRAVDGVSMSVQAGTILGVLGESGSGKSQLFKGISGLSSGNVSGRALFDGQDMIAMPPAELNRLRGRDIAFVLQDPMTALNPFLTIRTQLTEVATRHLGLSRRAATARAAERLTRVRIPDPDRVLGLHPHELSGGMRQRVVVAMALMAEPKLLIADEPTTALDATVQLAILRLLRRLNRELGLTIVVISHDIGVMAGICDELMVMYAGRVSETGTTERLLAEPRHPYTRRLIDSTPRLGDDAAEALTGIPGHLPGPDAARAQCLFAPRCFRAQSDCTSVQPALSAGGERAVACHHPLEAA